LGVAMAIVRGRAGVKAAVGIAADIRGRAAVKAAVEIAADRALTSWVWRWRQ
jgi:hypothetical protein